MGVGDTGEPEGRADLGFRMPAVTAAATASNSATRGLAMIGRIRRGPSNDDTMIAAVADVAVVAKRPWRFINRRQANTSDPTVSKTASKRSEIDSGFTSR